LVQKSNITFSNATVEQDAPRKPHSTGQIESILLGVVTLGQFEPTKWTEPVK